MNFMYDDQNTDTISSKFYPTNFVNCEMPLHPIIVNQGNQQFVIRIHKNTSVHIHRLLHLCKCFHLSLLHHAMCQLLWIQMTNDPVADLHFLGLVHLFSWRPPAPSQSLRKVKIIQSLINETIKCH